MQREVCRKLGGYIKVLQVEMVEAEPMKERY